MFCLHKHLDITSIVLKIFVIFAIFIVWYKVQCGLGGSLNSFDPFLLPLKDHFTKTTFYLIHERCNIYNSLTTLEKQQIVNWISKTWKFIDPQKRSFGNPNILCAYTENLFLLLYEEILLTFDDWSKAKLSFILKDNINKR